MSQKITVSAPGKLMLVGGHAVVHGRATVVTSVSQRLFVTVEKNGADVFLLNAPDLGLTAYSKTIADLGKKELPKAVQFVEILYKRFLEKYPQDHGIVVTTKSDFSASFGFGSSSAVTVAFAKALTGLYDLKFSNQDLFEMCYQTVLEVQGVGSGFDIASAIWGGTIRYVKPAKVVESIQIAKLPLVVGYTGVKADTPTLVRMVDSKLAKNSEKYNQLFDEIGQTASEVQTALEHDNLEQLGTAFNTHQELMRKIGVSSNRLEELITASLAAGAVGATLSGAGGGDCMIAAVSEENRTAVEKAIQETGGEIMHVGLGEEGVRIEK